MWNRKCFTKLDIYVFITLAEHLSSLPGCSGVRVALSDVFCVLFCRSLFVLLPIVLSVLLSFTASGCPFGMSKHFEIYEYISSRISNKINKTKKIHKGTQHSMSILTFLQVYVVVFLLLFISIIGWDAICSNMYISVHLVNH